MISPSIRKPIEELGLHGVLRALETQYGSNEFDDLSYEEASTFSLRKLKKTATEQ